MIRIITGPPCAGKSTFVQQAASIDALIIDFDALAKAFGSTEAHNSTGYIRETTFIARQAAIDYALKHPDKEAWIIHTSPTPTQLTQYETAGAIIQVIDPGQAECLARAEQDQRPGGTPQAINNWYEARSTQKGIKILLRELRG